LLVEVDVEQEEELENNRGDLIYLVGYVQNLMLLPLLMQLPLLLLILNLLLKNHG
jgi:hypothetical protein